MFSLNHHPLYHCSLSVLASPTVAYRLLAAAVLSQRTRRARRVCAGHDGWEKREDGGGTYVWGGGKEQRQTEDACAWVANL